MQVSTLLCLLVGSPVKAEILPMQTSAQPGKPFEVAIRVNHSGGWHSYWMNPGDSGMAPKIEWRLPTGWKAGPIIFPTPNVLTDGEGGTIYGYSEHSIWFTKITPAKTAVLGSNETFGADISFMICKDACEKRSLLGEAAIVVSNAHPSPAPLPIEFKNAHHQIPIPKRALVTWRSLTPNELCIQIEIPAFATQIKPMFISSEPGVLQHTQNQLVSIESDTITLQVNRSEFSASVPSRLRGVLIISGAGTSSANYWIDEPIQKKRGK